MAGEATNHGLQGEDAGIIMLLSYLAIVMNKITKISCI